MNNDTITISLSKTGKHAGKYETIIDDIDSDLAELNWQFTKSSNTFYAQRSSWNRFTKSRYVIMMHRVILARKLERRELLPTESPDHINGNGLDNRRENLRLATGTQNQANQIKPKNNTSGIKGVIWDKSRNKWQARIGYKGKTLHLGRFNNREDAQKAYCEKAKELHGEYANCGERDSI